MENAVEALKMAGSVLLFVIALSVAILAFTQSRQAIDAVLKYSDRESLTIEGDSRFYYLSNKSDTSRYVGKETIIPTIYRAYKENYKIIFKFPDDHYLFKSNGKEVHKIDLASQSIGSDQSSRKFIEGILYGADELQAFKQTFKIEPHSIPLYTYLTEKERQSYKIKEELGTYYMEDLKTEPEDDSEKSNIEEVNKQEKRVITYTFELIT